MNLTFLLQLASLYMPYYFFDSNEKYYPIEMIDMLSDNKLYGSFYYDNTFLSNDISTYDELLKYVIVEKDQYIYSNLTYTNNQTLYKIRGNEKYIFDGIKNENNPIYIEYIYDQNSLYVIYTNLYMFNGEINCGFVIPCGFHEGDIEHVIIEFNILNYNPSKIFLSSHRDGYWFDWKTIDKYDKHPLIYIASMTHANYPMNGVFFRYFGFINDKTDGKILWKPKKKIILHYNFNKMSKEYMFNGYVGDIGSFPNKKQKYEKQIKTKHNIFNKFSMLSDLFFSIE